MKYFSEKLNRLFDDEASCVKAEKEHDEALRKAEEEKQKKNATRAERAKEVEDALNELVEAKKNYAEKLQAFCKDYGAWHYTFKDSEPFKNDIFDFWL